MVPSVCFDNNIEVPFIFSCHIPFFLQPIKAGDQPCPTEPSASRKLHGQWEIPLSFCPNDIPTATLANGMTAHAQARVQGRAEAPQGISKTNVPAAVPAQQEAYDLLADFPALGPPLRPLAMGEAHNVHPKAKEAKGKRGITHLPNPRQESEASQQRTIENVLHEVSPICAGDQKSVLDLQKIGSASQRNSPTISCEEKKANNQITLKGINLPCLCPASLCRSR